MRCKFCDGCFQHRIVNSSNGSSSSMYLYCDLCQKYYIIENRILVDKTEEVRELIKGESKNEPKYV